MLISIGFKNYILLERIVSVISPDSRPVRNLIATAREQDRLIDATMGKKTKSVIVVNSNHVILSANAPETIFHRVNEAKKGK